MYTYWDLRDLYIVVYKRLHGINTTSIRPTRSRHPHYHTGPLTCTHRRLMGCVAVCVFVVGAQHRWHTVFLTLARALFLAVPRTNVSFSLTPSIPRSPLTGRKYIFQWAYRAGGGLLRRPVVAKVPPGVDDGYD